MSEILDLHKPLAAWLDKQGVPYIRARSDKQSTIAEGHPDFTLTFQGRVIFLELKTEKGRLSKEQVGRIAFLEAAGNRVHVARDIASAINFVTEWMRQLGEVSRPKDEPNLVRFGGAVCKKTPHGLVHVRVATLADAHIPHF